MHLELWTEKYRPQTLDEVIDQKHIVSRLKAWVKKGSVPHMLFAGPAGVGKTTIALCLAHELFGDKWKSNFQETNASDERGINIVRKALEIPMRKIAENAGKDGSVVVETVRRTQKEKKT
jgi:replication factor C small subunit